MDLWTEHKLGWKITSGKTDHRKSEYYRKIPRYKVEYPKLLKCIGQSEGPFPGQIVWCYTVKRDPYSQKTMWDLKVPDDDIICFLNSEIWNRILFGDDIEPPDAMKLRWLEEAVAAGCDDTDAYEEQKIQEYRSHKPATGSWWDELIVDGPGKCSSAIIPHPVPVRWLRVK